MTILKKLVLAACLGFFAMVGTASAHLVAFGWNDNGNGTVTMFGEHWHGDQTFSYSDNQGVTIDGILFQWIGVLNNSDRDVMMANGSLDGFALDNGGAKYGDWFYTAPMVIGNGLHTMFTGTLCCVDTMTQPKTYMVTGISSVPPGTGPAVVPEPASIALFGLGILGLGLVRRRKM